MQFSPLNLVLCQIELPMPFQQSNLIGMDSLIYYFFFSQKRTKYTTLRVYESRIPLFFVGIVESILATQIDALAER